MTVVFEVSSAGLTTFRSIQALNVGGPWRTQKEGFMYLLFEQGLLYFCVVSVLTVASLALNVSIPGGFLQRLLNAYTIPLSGLMTARFLLHLRMWESNHAAFRSRPRNRVDEDCDEDEDSTGMDFVSNPNHQRSRTVTLDSFVEDFGEDPVRRARASSINFSRSGGGGTQDGLAG
ncbi:hypothetical protein Hypma_004050 [Hypsizygus marmoreus]|uniref:Uncharacterized protein n=1 Tax=Hypsizygus marmoreus TaxID=39966 RepID=A0A369J5B7_HYPMA|nr:hypothetical protein Hypma_004050 [Hypsizygus marmoreus]